MAQHFVICKYCGKTFNRDKEPTVQVSARRYAHKKCAEDYENNKTQEQQDIEALYEYIMKIFNIPYVNPRIKKQINTYRDEYHYTYSGMLKTLTYWFGIKGNSIEQAHGGIGIIPYIYNEAREYYYRLYLAQKANKDKNIEEYKLKEKIVCIPPPFIQQKKLRMFFDNEKEQEKVTKNE